MNVIQSTTSKRRAGLCKQRISLMLLLCILLIIMSGCLTVNLEPHIGSENNVEIRFETPMDLRQPTETSVARTVVPTSIPATTSSTAIKALSTATKSLIAVSATPGIGSTMVGQDGMTLVYVPAGKFIMGTKAEDAFAQTLELDQSSSTWPYDDLAHEGPPHEVYLDAYWIDKTEVTNKMYSLCVKDLACKPLKSSTVLGGLSYYGNPKYDYYPVINVDWNMAKSYCEWVDRRLPTEAEWEKTARGTDRRIFPWGNEFNEKLANIWDGSSFAANAPTAVGSYEGGKSPYGAYDMAGNVWEWVADWYDPTYYATLGNNSVNPQLISPLGQYRVVRGGSWTDGADGTRTSGRLKMEPSWWRHSVGFRCAVSGTQLYQTPGFSN